MDRDEARRELIRIASDMLAERLDIISGCRQLCDPLVRAGLHVDRDALTIAGVDSESDLFPLGEVRARWAEAALVEMDAQREAYVAEARPRVLAACRALIDKIERTAP